MKLTLKEELDMWLENRRQETSKAIEEIHLAEKDKKRIELFKLDLLLVQLEATLGLQDGIKLWDVSNRS